PRRLLPGRAAGGVLRAPRAAGGDVRVGLAAAVPARAHRDHPLVHGGEPRVQQGVWRPRHAAPEQDAPLPAGRCRAPRVLARRRCWPGRRPPPARPARADPVARGGRARNAVPGPVVCKVVVVCALDLQRHPRRPLPRRLCTRRSGRLRRVLRPGQDRYQVWRRRLALVVRDRRPGLPRHHLRNARRAPRRRQLCKGAQADV
ncbi:hypothetical protein H4R19_007148, partial [Coemansia spiralis]